jgi:hypothetical protein
VGNLPATVSEKYKKVLAGRFFSPADIAPGLEYNTVYMVDFS